MMHDVQKTDCGLNSPPVCWPGMVRGFTIAHTYGEFPRITEKQILIRPFKTGPQSLKCLLSPLPDIWLPCF